MGMVAKRRGWMLLQLLLWLILEEGCRKEDLLPLLISSVQCIMAVLHELQAKRIGVL